MNVFLCVYSEWREERVGRRRKDGKEERGRTKREKRKEGDNILIFKHTQYFFNDQYNI